MNLTPSQTSEGGGGFGTGRKGYDHMGMIGVGPLKNGLFPSAPLEFINLFTNENLKSSAATKLCSPPDIIQVSFQPSLFLFSLFPIFLFTFLTLTIGRIQCVWKTLWTQSAIHAIAREPKYPKTRRPGQADPGQERTDHDHNGSNNNTAMWSKAA